MHANPSRKADAQTSAGEAAIMDSAVRLFSENGFDGVSMRQIAESAGVSKANIYHHFQSKEALYLAIIRQSAGRLTRLIENLEEGRGDFDQRLRQFANAHLDHVFENSMTVRLVLREAFSGDEDKSRLLVEQFVGGIIKRLIAIFKSGQETGVLRPDLDPALCAMQLMGSDLFYFQSYGMLKHLPEARFALDRSEYSREMMDVLLNGMLVPGRGGRAPS